MSESKKINHWVWDLVIFGIVLTAFFGFRSVRSFAQVWLTGLKPGTTDVEAIRGWMTIPYLATIYCVSPDTLYQKIDVPAAGSHSESLAELNRKYFSEQPGIVLQKVKDAIRLYHPVCPPREPRQ